MIGTETDITQRKLAEEELEHLSARLLDLQDQERQRVARELHEGTAQDIAAITIKMESLKRSRVKLPAKFQDAITECQTLCRQTLNDVRTLSYVLHPPILDTAGLLAALRWYVGEFVKSTGIDVQLVSSQDFGRLPTAIETDLFRIVQECLENVQRHSGSGTAQIHLELQSGHIVLKVQDQGRGMTPKTLRTVGLGSRPPGVGLSEIRQRLRDLDGRLEITSNSHGTTITAVVPLDEKAVRAFVAP
jgi:signal transduction histidine kinase